MPEEEKKKPNLEKTQIWMAAAVVFLGLFLVSVFTHGFTGMAVSDEMSKQDLEVKVMDFVNKALEGRGVKPNLLYISETRGLYEVAIGIEGEKLILYVTKDGEYFTERLAPLDLEIRQPAQQAPEAPEAYSEEDLEKIGAFVDCLAEKNFKIYGANWCGWTKKLVVDTFGGFEMAKPIYVECTENEDVCTQEGVSTFPTIKIDGELYNSNDRSFGAFAKATGCIAPGVGAQPASNGDASCG